MRLIPVPGMPKVAEKQFRVGRKSVYLLGTVSYTHLFRRLGEVFVPPKKDTAIQVKTSLEFATDTVIAVSYTHLQGCY